MTKGINPELNIGDKIVILHMGEEPNVVPIGTKGEVTGISNTPWGIQYQVKWDNGSSLDIIPEVDFWRLEKKSIKESMLDDLKKKKDVLNIFKYMNNPDVVLNFLFSLQSSGITNMLELSNFLTMGSNDLRRFLIGRYSDEEIEDRYEELIDAADPMRNEVISGLMNYMKDNDLSYDDMDKVNREFQKFVKKIATAYFTSYDMLKKRFNNLNSDS